MGQTSSAPKVTSQDKAIFQMKMQRDKLLQYQTKLTSIIEKEVEIAKQCLKDGKKEKAKLALRHKKYQESMISKTFEQLNTLEELISTVEFKLVEKNVLYGLQEGNKVLGQLNKELNIEKIEKILDETEEGVRYQQEVSAMLGESMSYGEEEEVDEELAQMEREELAKLNPVVEEEAQKMPQLPEVPKNKLVEDEPIKQKKTETREHERGEPLLA